MRVSLKYPSELVLEKHLKRQKTALFNYNRRLGTKEAKVDGYDNDLNSILLGKGEQVWKNAKMALDQWKQFPPEWTKIYDIRTPLKTDKTVLVIFRLFGIWWINSARIVYTLNDENTYGFAYGTLNGHVERGEECFWIDRDQDGNVHYHIKAFSKPDFWGAKLAYPIARAYQRKFVRESMAHMKQLANVEVDLVEGFF